MGRLFELCINLIMMMIMNLKVKLEKLSSVCAFKPLRRWFTYHHSKLLTLSFAEAVLLRKAKRLSYGCQQRGKDMTSAKERCQLTYSITLACLSLFACDFPDSRIFMSSLAVYFPASHVCANIALFDCFQPKTVTKEDSLAHCRPNAQVV